ncbi:MAG: class I SAM-dependent methyltransferase [Chromatiales bacterium]
MTTTRQAPPLVAIFLLSASALAYEVLLVRLFSIIHWHHFAFMVISLALLGYGVSGSLIMLFRSFCQRHFTGVFFLNILLYGISSVGVFVIIQRLPFNALEILWDSSQWLRLLLTYLFLSLPFLFVANTIALTMLRFDMQIARIYSADLIGAGAGAIGIMLLLTVFEPPTVLRLLAFAGLLAGVFVLRQTGRQLAAALALALVASGILLLPGSWLELRLSDYKGLVQTLRIDGARLVESHSGPVSRIDVVENRLVPFRNAPGLSLQSPEGPSEQLAVFSDGDAMTTIDRHSAQSSPGYMAYMSSALPFLLGRQFERVLVLNAGTGADILQAAAFDSRHIDAVEPDSQLTRLVSETFSGYSGWQQLRGRVELHNTTARAWAATADQPYDLVVIGVPGASSGGAAGVYAFSANFDLTVEALKSYLALLAPGGYLSITLWTDTPPKGNLRLFSAMVEALRESGVASPENRLAWIRSWNTATLMVKHGELNSEETTAIRRFSESRNFDLAWLPGISEDEVNRYQLLPRPFFYTAAKAVLSGQGKDYMESYQYDIEPVRDVNPYFDDHFRWNSLSTFLALPGRSGIAMIGAGYPTLVATLLQAIIAALLLILAPLFFLRRKLRSDGHLRFRVFTYFTAIGLAFLFIELSFIEMLTLVIGQPLYAVAVTLSVFLVFSGLGSLTVHWFVESKGLDPGVLLRWSVLSILLVTLVYLFSHAWLIEHLMALPTALRILMAILLSIPIAFVMGMPFPVGLTSTSRNAPELLPWAWGINGCASVLSAILAVLLGMEIGFTGVMLCAVMLYLLAWRTLPRKTLI